MAAPPEKKQKTGEEPEAAQEPKDAEMKEAEEAPKEEEKPKEPEPPKELETDATEPRSKNKEPVLFLTPDTTLNVLPSTHNNVLTSLREGGIQHFMAGARANVGIKSGRYLFEVKIVEYAATDASAIQGNNRNLAVKHLVRVGFSTAKAGLVLGSSDQGVCFESEGAFVCGKTRGPGARFGRDNVVAVLLNLDKDSPNFNTVSLFRDGQRVSQPAALPDSLKGQVLFPHVSFKNATLHVNFGPTLMAPLPFKVFPVGVAAKTDTSITKHEAPADGKYEVIYPVSLPDEGTFDWLDMFHEKNPGYTELSDRAILEWAEQSGIWKPKGYGTKTSHDKPDMHFQVRELDDFSARRTILSIAPLQQRNFVVMEVKGNLLKDERKELLARFAGSGFKKTAVVLMGTPSADFKKRVHAMILKDKQLLSDRRHALEQAEEKRKREVAKKQKEMERQRKKLEKEKKKALAEAKKKAEEEKKKAAAEKGEEEGKKEGEEGEKKEEPAVEPPEKEEEEEPEEPEAPEEEPAEVPPPKVELSAEEKKLNFRKTEVKDLAPNVLSANFAKFSLPEKEEGFDEVRHEWSKDQKESEKHLAAWIKERKLTTRIEDLVPSTWFHEKSRNWTLTLKAWHTKQDTHRAAAQKKAHDRAAAEARRQQAKARAAAAAAAAAAQKEKEEKEKAEKKEGEEGEKKEGEAAAAPEEKKEEAAAAEPEKKEAEPEPMEVEEPEEPPVEVDDVFAVDDVTDIGKGTPLFKDFTFEDWAMMNLRFELHLLAHAFIKDANDPERLGIHMDHLGFYYNKYYKKTLSAKDYGQESYKELVELVSDTLFVTPQQVVESQLDPEMESLQVFVKLAEEARRYRLLRIDLGDASAVLKVTPHRDGGRGYDDRRGQKGHKGGQYEQGWGKGGQEQGWGKGGAGDKGHRFKGQEKGAYAPKGAQTGGAVVPAGKVGDSRKGGWTAPTVVPAAVVPAPVVPPPATVGGGGSWKGQDRPSYGKDQSSYGKGKEQSSYGKDQSPYGKGKEQSSYGKDQSSYGGKNQSSYGGKDQSSYGNNQSSYGKDQSSYGKGKEQSSYGYGKGKEQSSYGNQQSSYGNQQSSYGKDQSSSYGKDQSSYGKGKSGGGSSYSSEPYGKGNSKETSKGTYGKWKGDRQY